MNKKDLEPTPLLITEDEVWEAVEHIMKTIKNTSFRDSLNIIRHNGFYLKKAVRSVKIKEHSQVIDAVPYTCTIVPKMSLRGKWLQRSGFRRGNKVWVLPFTDLIIIIPRGAE